MKEHKKSKTSGITLIALVVTIIVLLLLAGISIMMLNGNNGIINRAIEASKKSQDTQIEERVKLAYLAALISKEEKPLKELLNEQFDNEFGKNNYQLSDDLTKIMIDGKEYEISGIVLSGPREKITKDKNGTIIKKIENVTEPWLPSAMTEIINNDLTTGLVIKDEFQNEWVWVEVPKSIYTDSNYTTDLTENSQGKKQVTSATDYDGIYKVLNSYASPYRKGKADQDYNWKDEWYDFNGYTYDGTNWYKYDGTLVSDYLGDENDTTGCGLTRKNYNIQYQRMLRSIYTNGGFWVGRYEAGVSYHRTIRTLPTVSPMSTSQANKEPYTYVYCSDAQKIAEKTATSDKSNENFKNYTSSLMFGIQWDLVCKFLENSSEWDTSIQTATQYINSNSSRWGVYNTKRANTGSLKTKRRNIFDFAGNVYEYTLEHPNPYSSSSFLCVIRGGNHNTEGTVHPASNRNANKTIEANSYTRF